MHPLLFNFLIFMLMANKVFSRPNVSRTSPRNAFDRSYVMNYDFSAGELHCVLCKPCIAGTKGKINRQVFTRSNEVNTAAFASLSQNFQFYKVPIRLLWSYWNDFKLQINDLNSSSLVALTTGQVTPNLSLPVGVPSVDISKYFVNASVLHDVGFEDGSAVITNSSVGSVNHQVRLLEELGYSVFADPHGVFSGKGSQVVSLLPMAAYQKVYYDHFRNTAYENNDPYAYNLDWFAQSKTILDLSADLDVSVFKRLSRMRYVNYRNDYFKNIYPSLNYVSSRPDGLSWKVPSSVMGVGDGTSFANVVSVDTPFSPRLEQNIGSASISRVSVQSIRAMFALDKLMRASAYAPKHVKDQFEARFGIKISDKVSNESEYLGSFSNDIVIGEVTSTANTTNGNTGDSLGAIGGKGIGSDRFGRDIDFYCDEDCFIIGVSYVLPRTSYDVNGIDGYNTKLNANDFFQPEFQDLGLEPLYRKEVAFDNGDTGQGSNNAIIGYRPRNEIYKVSYDKNFGSFKKNFVLVSSNDEENTVLNVHSGWLSPFVVHSSASSLATTSYWWFKCLPYHLDDIFVQSYDPLAPETNQFFSNVIVKFVTNQDMSVHGQPRM